MKNLLCLFFLSLFATSGFAQSSFYLSAQAGPSLSFSNSSNPYNYADDKLTSNYGIGFGYGFPNQLVKAETGIYRTNIFSIFGLNDYTHNYDDDQIYLSRDSWQIPLRFKLKFWQPTDRITLRAITGIVLSLTPDDFKLQGDLINVKDDNGQTTFQTISSAPNNTIFLFRGREKGTGGVDSNWLIESGLEVNYKLSEKVDGFLGVVYQGGLQSKYGGTVYEINTDSNNGKSYITRELHASSEANALNLNLGLIYAFGK